MVENREIGYRGCGGGSNPTFHGDNRPDGSAIATAALRNLRADDPDDRLIVLDFDLTIMNRHMWAEFKDGPLRSIPVQADFFADLPAFTQLVDACSRGGCGIAIASFGRKDVINKAMSFALGEKHGIRILTPQDFGFKDGSNALGDKNQQLEVLAKSFRVGAKQLILADDDMQNIKAARDAGVGFPCHCPHGLTREVIWEVVKFAGVDSEFLLDKGAASTDEDEVPCQKGFCCTQS